MADRLICRRYSYRISKYFSVILFVFMLFLAGCEERKAAVTVSKAENAASESSAEESNTSEGSIEESSKTDSSYTNEFSNFVDSEIIDTSEFTEDESKHPMPQNDELVRIIDYIPDIALDIRYATVNNFTGEIIYESAEAYLRYGTVKKLISVQNELKDYGYGLLIWDAYRPTEAQWKLWSICPDPSYVSDPNKKYSSHSRGNTVDISIVDSQGNALTMPSGFDEFGAAADRDYSDVSSEAAKNAEMLEEIMYKHGFSGYSKEWWHYTDINEYDVVE